MTRSELNAALVGIASHIWGPGYIKVLVELGPIPEQLKGITLAIFRNQLDQLGDPIETWVETIREGLIMLSAQGFLKFEEE